MKVILASDYRGYWVRQMAKAWLEAQGYKVVEFGAQDPATRDNYVEVADAAMQAFAAEKAERAVLVCGSGLGICMRANRYPFARAFAVQSRLTPVQAREHNDANVMCFSGERMDLRAIEHDLDNFFRTPFNAERRQDRVDALSAPASF